MLEVLRHKSLPATDYSIAIPTPFDDLRLDIYGPLDNVLLVHVTTAAEYEQADREIQEARASAASGDRTGTQAMRM